jgi:hypothetical protein
LTINAKKHTIHKMKKECGITIGEAVLEQTNGVTVDNSTAWSNKAGTDMSASGFSAEVQIPIRCSACPLAVNIVVRKTGMAPLADALQQAQEEALDYAREAKIFCTERL